MLDSFTSSANGLIVLLYIISLVVFFLVGPHKVYEAFFGACVGIGFYLLIHEMTFISPEITRGLFGGGWIFENRGSLLWFAKVLIVVLFFATPSTLGLNVTGVIRGTLWFFLKVLILSAFFVSFGTIIFVSLYQTTGIFSTVTILPASFFSGDFWTKSEIFTWILDKSSLIYGGAFVLGFYKILFSHWMTKVLAAGGVVYAKGAEVFGKKNFDAVSHGGGDHGGEDHGGGHDDHHEEHAHDSHDSHDAHGHH